MELTYLVKAYISYCHKSLIKLSLLSYLVLLAGATLWGVPQEPFKNSMAIFRMESYCWIISLTASVSN